MKVLYVEDDARDADLTRRELARSNPHIGLELASGLGEARERLGEGTAHDLVLTDLNLPDGSGLELLAEIRARALPVAAVVLTGSESGETALAAFKAGADDLMLKRNGYLARLPGVLEAALGRFRADAARLARPLRVLYAEDSAIDADLTRRHLARHAPNILLEVVHGAPELLQRLPRAAGEPPPCDVLLLDYRLAGADALEVLKTLRDERHLDLPAVLVTGQGDGEVAAQAFRFGAANYVVKHPGYLFELPAVLESAYDRAQLLRDIAGRKLIEEVLRRSEQRYRELVSTVPGAVYTFRVDAQGRRSFPFMSEGIGKLVGLSPAEVMADAEVGFLRIPAEAMPAVEQSIGTSMQELSPWIHEFPIRTASGEARWLRGQSLPRREADGATVWHGVFIDITERKRVEDALRDRETEMRLIAENLPAMIAYFDQDRRVRYANRRYAEFYAGLGLDVQGWHLRQVVGDQSWAKIEDHVARVLSGEPVAYEREMVCASGEPRSIAINIVPHRDASDKVIGAYTLVIDITRRKRAEEALRESETRFRAAFDQAAVGMARREIDGRFLDVNQKACDILGYTREELLGLTSVEISPPEERREAVAFNRRLRRGELSTYSREKQYLRKDGTPVWVNLSINVVNGSDGKPDHVIAVMEDITQRKQAERKLHKRGAQLHLLTENIPAAIAYFDRDQVIQVANQHYAKLYCGAGAEMVGRHARDVVGEKDWPQVAKHNARVVAGEPAVFERTHERPDGERREIEVHLEPDRAAGGEVRGYFAFVLDITERKRAREALRESEERFRATFEQAAVGIAHVGIDGRWLRVNQRLCDIMGYAREELLAGAFQDITHPDDLDADLEYKRRMLAGEIPTYSMEKRYVRKDGGSVWINVTVALVRKGSGEADYQISVIEDITGRKGAEEALLRFRIALDHSADMILLVDRSTMRYVDVNETACRLLGYSREEMCGMGPQDVLPDSREEFERYYDGLIADPSTAASMRIDYRRKDGSILPFESTRHVLRSGNGHLIVAISRDIRERLAVEQDLRASEERFRSLTELSSDWYWEQDENFRIVDTKDASARLSPLRAANYVGYTRWDAYAECLSPEQWAAHRRQLEAHEPFRDLEYPRLSQDGQMRWVSISGLPIFDEEGRFKGYRGIGKDITERKLAQDNLRRFRAAIDFSADLVLLIDPARMLYVDANETACRALGYSREELLAMGPQDIFSVSREAMAGIYGRLIAGDLRETAAEGWYRRKDGSRLLVESFRRAVPFAKGHAIVAVARDITERKVTENALRLLSTGMAHLSGEVFFNEVASRVAEYLDAEIGFVNRLQAPAYTRIRTLGLCIDRRIMPPVEFDLAHTPCEAVIGKQPAVLPEQVQRLFPAFRMAADLGVSGYAAVPLFDTHGKPIGAVGVMSRAPLRQGAERIEALLRLFAVRTAAEIERLGAEARFKDLFEFSADACLIVNQAGIVTAMNQGARSLLGYSREELIGLPVDVLVPEPARAGHAGMRRNFHAAAASRPMGSGQADLHARRKDGTTFPADIDLHPLQTDDGAVVVATVRDMTGHKRAERERTALESQLRQSQKMEAIGTLAGGIAHDFNNIIGAILGNAELAREDVGPGHPARESIAEIDKAGRRARDLVQQILAFSRKQALSRQVIALGPVVQEAVKLLQATLPAGVRLAADCVAGLPNVSADPTQIHQVLVNLCTNAWHAMEGRPGHIDIRLEEVTVDAALSREHAGLQPGKCVRLSVRDTGKGMDAAMLERIFEPFFTTKPIDEGTGLGLSVVHGIMQGHEGAIVVHSTPGTGTTFQLYFPAVDAPAAAQRAATAVLALPRGRQQHVLYLDDDEALVSLVGRMLERQGYRVSGHTLAQQALAAVRADPGGFDLVVTDYNMPGMSGLDVARELSGIRPGLPVAVTSGYITDELRERAPQSGVRHLIYKPDTVDELCEVVRRLTSQAD